MGEGVSGVVAMGESAAKGFLLGATWTPCIMTVVGCICTNACVCLYMSVMFDDARHMTCHAHAPNELYYSK